MVSKLSLYALPLLFLQISLVSTAAVMAEATLPTTSSLCETLPEYTCSEGLHADGTGAVQKVPPEDISNEAIVKKHRALIDAGIAKFMKAASTTELSSLCQPSPDSCQTQIPQRLLAAVLRSLGVGADEAGSAGSSGAGGAAKADDSESKRAIEASEELRRSEKFTRLIQELRAQISQREVDPQKVKLLESRVFPELKEALLKKIATFPLTPSLRQKVLARVRKIRLDKSYQCDAGIVPMLFAATLVYNANTNSIHVCEGLLGKNFSEFKLAQAIAHEMTHSFDPCNIADVLPAVIRYSSTSDLAVRDSEYLWPEVLQCLRSQSSIGARAWPSDPVVSSSDDDSNHAKSDEPPYYDYCDKDQVIEAFADWMSAELFTTYISRHYPHLTRQQWYEGYSNIFRFNCYEKFEEQDRHPAIAQRISRILVANPVVRQKLGCAAPTGLNYCQIGGAEVRMPSSRRGGHSSGGSGGHSAGALGMRHK
jgi:hypothetical protein